MVFSLAACGGDSSDDNGGMSSNTAASDSGTGASTEIFTTINDYEVEVMTDADGNVTYDGLTADELEASMPKEHIPQKLAAGIEVSFAFLCVNLESTAIATMSKTMESICNEYGITYYVQEMKMDVATQLDKIENFLTMGVSMIATFCIDEDATADTANKVMESGTALIIMDGTPTFDTSLTIYTEQYDVGKVAGQMVSAWIDEQLPDAGEGEVKLAVMNNVIIPSFVTQYSGFEDAIKEDSRIEIVSVVAGSDHTIDEGYTFAEDTFGTYPDVQIIYTQTASQAIGVNNYIIGSGLASDDIAIFAPDTSDEGRQTVEASTDSSVSVFRGLVGVGTADRGVGIMDKVFKLVTGEIEEGSLLSEGMYTEDTVGFNFDNR